MKDPAKQKCWATTPVWPGAQLTQHAPGDVTFQQSLQSYSSPSPVGQQGFVVVVVSVVVVVVVLLIVVVVVVLVQLGGDPLQTISRSLHE